MKKVFIGTPKEIAEAIKEDLMRKSERENVISDVRQSILVETLDESLSHPNTNI